MSIECMKENNQNRSPNVKKPRYENLKNDQLEIPRKSQQQNKIRYGKRESIPRREIVQKQMHPKNIVYRNT